MSIKIEEILAQDLQLGMYVSQLDRPWIETPFPMQGFHVRTQEDVDKLRVWCKHVYIDVQLGKGPLDFQASSPTPSKSAKAVVRPGAVRGNLGKFTPTRYVVSSDIKKEVAKAAPHHREITRAVVKLF